MGQRGEESDRRGGGGLSRCRGGKEDWGMKPVNERGHNGVEESEGFKIIVEHRG